MVDLVRFGLALSSVLPDALAREAFGPQAELDDGPGSQAASAGCSCYPRTSRGQPRRQPLRILDHQAEARRSGAAAIPESCSQLASSGRTRQQAPDLPDHLSNTHVATAPFIAARAVRRRRARHPHPDYTQHWRRHIDTTATAERESDRAGSPDLPHGPGPRDRTDP